MENLIESLHGAYSYKGMKKFYEYAKKYNLKITSIYNMIKTKHLRAVSVNNKGKVFRLWYNPDKNRVYNTTREAEASKRRIELSNEYRKAELARKTFLSNLANPEW